MRLSIENLLRVGCWCSHFLLTFLYSNTCAKNVKETKWGEIYTNTKSHSVKLVMRKVDTRNYRIAILMKDLRQQELVICKSEWDFDFKIKRGSNFSLGHRTIAPRNNCACDCLCISCAVYICFYLEAVYFEHLDNTETKCYTTNLINEMA